jgi:hypothetical protein
MLCPLLEGQALESMFARIICAATPQQDKGRGGRRRRRRRRERERESKGTLNESKPFIHSSMELCLSFLFFAFGPNQVSSFVCDVQVR